MKPTHAITLLLAAFAAAAQAQDATRGEALYRALPGSTGLGSCISCHGEAVNNRNSVLRGGQSGGWISRTITAVGVMGYLRQQLTEADLADISAYLATVAPAGAVEQLPAPWPSSDDFGAQLAGTESAPRTFLIRNPSRSDIAVAAVQVADGLNFAIQHDCPLSLPPQGQCQAQVRFRPQATGAVSSTWRILDSSGRALRSATLGGTGVASAPATLVWASGTPSLLDFDRVAQGQSVRRVLQLRNPSLTDISLSTLRSTGPNAARFVLDAPCLAQGRLAAGAACEVGVSYSPTTLERHEAWIEVGAAATSPTLVRLSGLGEAAAPAPSPAPAPGPAPSAGGGGGASSWGWLLALAVAGWGLRRPRA